MAHIPLIRANVMSGAVAYLEGLKVPIQPLLEDLSFPDSMQASETLIPLTLVLQFFESTAHLLNIPYLGLLVGQQTQISMLGTLGRLLSHSSTLRDAISLLIHAVPFYNSGDRVWLVEQEEVVWLCRRFINEIRVDCHQATCYSLMLMINLVHLAAGSDWQPTEIHFEIPYLVGVNQVDLLSQTTILFEQEATAVALPRSLLDLPLQNIDEYDNSQRQQDYKTLQSSAPATDFLGSLRQTISFLLQIGCPNIQCIAKLTGMSVRTLQRHLHEIGFTYSDLVEQVRYERAIQLLNSPTSKLADIASELGYKDASNFTRAFKRWTGVSPKTYSIRHLKT